MLCLITFHTYLYLNLSFLCKNVHNDECKMSATITITTGIARMAKQIKKIQEHCSHQHQKELTNIEFDWDYGVYYETKTKKCLDCGLTDCR